MTKEELKNRTKQFALNVFKFLMSLDKNKAVDVVSYQLLNLHHRLLQIIEQFAEVNQVLIF